MIYSPPGVDVHPDANMLQWEVYEVTFQNGDTSRHLVGWCNGWDGRATSAIQKFDANTRTITTRSGRVYTIEGESGFHPDAHYVWAHWKAINGVVSEKDVTHEYEENPF